MPVIKRIHYSIHNTGTGAALERTSKNLPPLFPDVFHSSIHRCLAITALVFLGSLVSGYAVTLLPQEQAIADDMVGNSDQGRPYMVLDPIIEAVARARAEDMATRNYFSEVNPDGVAADYLLTQAGYKLPSWWSTAPATNYVESIAAGSSDPRRSGPPG